MNLLPNWTIVIGALVVGLGAGVIADHTVMSARADKVAAAHAEELRQREVKRSKDEVAAREEERRLTLRASEIEQEKINAIDRVRSDADSLIARLRQQAASKPASPSVVPSPGAACESPAGGAIPDRSGEDTVRLAERADTIRAGLAACYQAYDTVAR